MPSRAETGPRKPADAVVALEPYEPINVLKPVVDDPWIVEGPIVQFDYFGSRLRIPFSTRMTIVRLSDGGLWVHSPTPLAPPLREAVDRLGPVRHIVSPNRIHTTWIGEWKRAYPAAVTWGAPGKAPVVFDRTLDPAPDPAWAADVDQVLVPGGYMTEAEFFHRASRTLILTDLIENFEPMKLRSGVYRLLVRLSGAIAPRGGTPVDLRMTFLPRRRAVRRAVATMISWRPERVVVSHGAWFERDGTAALRRALGWAL